MDVVSNRVNHKAFPKTFCEVVQYRKAFSWYWYIGKEMPKDELDWVEHVKARYVEDKVELAALERALILARWHYETDPPDQTKGSLYYMTLRGLKNILSDIKSYNLVELVQDHLFMNNIVWR